MKCNLFILFFTILTLTQLLTQSQNSNHPWKLGIGVHAIDYNVDSNYTEDLFGNDSINGTRDWNFDPVFSRYTIGGRLNNSFSLQGGLALATISEDLEVNPTRGGFYMDVDLALLYHLANGYLFKEDACIDPYLYAGAGLNYLEIDNEQMNLFESKAGLGFDIWLWEKLGFNIETGYSWQGDEGTSYAHHKAGLVLRFGKGTDTDGDGISDYEDACPDKAGLEIFNGCPDSDGDGITDASDACPIAAGLPAFNGCPDSDGDGIADKEDKCPNQAGMSQFGGCPDSDGDGVADNDDRCPKDKGFAAFNGCPDTDGDGIADMDDACPKEKGMKQWNGCPDTDGDGVADKDDRCPKDKGDKSMQGCPDTDGDGVANIDDNCPDKIGPKNNKGCPIISDVERADIKKKVDIAAKNIFFETSSDVIKKPSYADLDNIVNIMNLYPGTAWQIDGHTDSQGNDASNMDLSNRRAASVKKYFTDKGIDAARLNSAGYGETKPVATNDTAAGRAQNRRVEIKVTN